MAAMGDEPVRRGIISRLVVVGDTADNDRSNSPEHLQHLRGWSSQSQGHNFSTVGGSVGDENSPRNTFHDLGSEKHALAVTKVEDEDGSV